jgi:hypothetical protein
LTALTAQPTMNREQMEDRRKIELAVLADHAQQTGTFPVVLREQGRRFF